MTGHEHVNACAWCRGYEEQAAWLQGKSGSEAEHALAERLATLSGAPYNDGGTVATRDYITAQEATR